MGAAKKVKKLTTAYWVVDVPGGWGVACCVEGERGYHPVDDYGPYKGKKGKLHAEGIVGRLNERLGHGPAGTYGHITSVRRVVGSTMSEPKPRRKHTPYNPNACPICAPSRCEVARRREQQP
jgi:hypothetical protein